MLSKEDYRDYLKQIEKVEKDMREVYRICAEKSEDEKIKKVCLKLLEDETRHREMVLELEKDIGV